MMATLLSLAGYLLHILCMVVLSCLVITISVGAIQNTKIWWPELIHTSIVALTFLLLNRMWGTPFEKPSTDDPVRKSALVGYLIYIVSSMAVSYNFFGLLLLLRTFVVSLTFVLLDMFVKPSSVSDTITTLAGLSWMIATTLLALFFLVALSFVVFMFLHTWAEILLPFPMVYNYPLLTLLASTGILGLTFMAMKTMLGIPVEKASIFSDVKLEISAISDIINGHQVAYLVIRYLIILSVPLLSRAFRRTTSIFKLYTMASFIVSLGLVLTMPSTKKPASTLDLDYFLQRTITSFVTHTIMIQITIIGGIMLYVMDIYDSWKQTITKIGDEFISRPLLEAKNNIMDLVYRSTLGWCGKKIVNGSTRRSDSRVRRR